MTRQHPWSDLLRNQVESTCLTEKWEQKHYTHITQTESILWHEMETSTNAYCKGIECLAWSYIIEWKPADEIRVCAHKGACGPDHMAMVSAHGPLHSGKYNNVGKAKMPPDGWVERQFLCELWVWDPGSCWSQVTVQPFCLVRLGTLILCINVMDCLFAFTLQNSSHILVLMFLFY